MAWVVVPSLLALRAEFNALAPRRDKGADGTIGDSAHTSRSDHTPDEDSDYLRDHDPDSKNEVHALDIDSSGPWPPGRSFTDIIADIIAGERAKWLSETDRCRLKYVIFNRQIYSQSTDFRPVRYTGSDPHTNHAHFSGRYETACENDTRPFGVYPPPAPERPAPTEEEQAEMDFWASAAKAARGDADATATDRTNRNNAVQVIRFALGLQVDAQTTENLPSGPDGQLARIEETLALLANEPAGS